MTHCCGGQDAKQYSKEYTKTEAETLAATMLFQHALQLEFSYNGYSALSYLAPGQKAPLLHSGSTCHVHCQPQSPPSHWHQILGICQRPSANPTAMVPARCALVYKKLRRWFIVLDQKWLLDAGKLRIELTRDLPQNETIQTDAPSKTKTSKRQKQA